MRIVLLRSAVLLCTWEKEAGSSESQKCGWNIWNACTHKPFQS